MSVRLAAGVLAGGVLWLAMACSGGGATDATSPPVPKLGGIQGAVADSAGLGVGGAGLSLTATGRSTLTASSGSDGRFAFSQVEPGSWTLTLTPPSGFNVSGESAVAVTVAASQTASVNFKVVKPAPPPPPPPPPPPAGDGVVNISGFAFSPATVTIAKGSKVTWTNKDAAAHTATADGASFDTGNLGTNVSGSVTFSTVGTFAYHCEIHPTMKGTVIVQ